MKNYQQHHLLVRCPWFACGFLLILAASAQAQSPASPPVADDTVLSMLAEPIQSDLQAIPSDPAPKEIIRGVHYVISNEYKLELFHEALSDLKGGIHIGVGAEQNYLFAGWSRPDILVLLDFDSFIVHLHKLYSIAFLNAATPKDFVRLWDVKSRKQFFRFIDASTEDRVYRAKLKRIYRHSRIFVSKRAKYIRRHYPKKNVPTFLTDSDQYNAIVRLYKTGRVLRVRGDFTANKTMKGIASFARKHNFEISSLYLSNVEYYFSFNTKHYRENILAQPFASNSAVMHTIPHSSKEYHYLWHTGGNFQEWLECRCVNKYRSLLKHSEKLGDPEKRRLTKSPPEKTNKKN